ncbi:hypothetical protein GLOIN_2v1790601 [Rhizophagus irregularis DAOM 181602=DAOM 197198]|uniref:Uncharacterized protein n=1 Tax=Rhizophagus irregularis (strain DAOM 181602 / DAOM 197198 / MUCL 43194) TaxID=747089 RepID=A0A2P4NYT8_RHIID|nr:hypothetical protein GLOIN_2v1790601 [Rhizophagus irregularis DAOM 181602=DAOM 197198]POG58287.1 hypothetical protein GLOIN_2v1790601 [Rhizophagus irregularis DAOM 181602=DAOM 197198]|eukprot:XP_025165153.1 hypothetical protein GLOIN_2v1790601 [Rhizophagus irregularis DAOM 181602=DAOM 197198]
MPPRTRNNSRIQEKVVQTTSIQNKQKLTYTRQKKAETLQSTIIGVEGSQKKQKRSYTSRQKEAAIQLSDVYTIIDVEEPLTQQLEDSITLKESNALIDFLNETNDYLSDTEDDETVQKEVTNKNDLEKSSRPQPTMPPKNQQKTTKTANTRIGVYEIDDDEEAVSNLVKLNDKKATKNVSGAVAGLNTNSTPVALNNIGNMFEICIWLSNNPHILQVANQLCAMRNMSPQSFDNEITSKTSTVLTASSVPTPQSDDKGSARLWLEEAKCLFLRCRSPPASSIEELIKEIFGYEPYTDNAIDIIKHTKKVRVTLNDLEIEDFIDEAVANKVFSRFLAATNRRLFNENGNMEILVGLLQSAFKASFNKRDIKSIKALDAITCNMQVFSKSGRNIAMNLELY